MNFEHFVIQYKQQNVQTELYKKQLKAVCKKSNSMNVLIKLNMWNFNGGQTGNGWNNNDNNNVCDLRITYCLIAYTASPPIKQWSEECSFEVTQIFISILF